MAEHLLHHLAEDYELTVSVSDSLSNNDSAGGEGRGRMIHVMSANALSMGLSNMSPP